MHILHGSRHEDRLACSNYNAPRGVGLGRGIGLGVRRRRKPRVGLSFTRTAHVEWLVSSSVSRVGNVWLLGLDWLFTQLTVLGGPR
jgi:hypothetical protein